MTRIKKGHAAGYVKLGGAVNEKDVEHWFRANLSTALATKTAKVVFSSPHNTDGHFVVKNRTSGLVECKFDVNLKNRTELCGVLAQLVHYLKRFVAAGDAIPKVVVAADKNEAAVVPHGALLPYTVGDYDWSKPPSAAATDSKLVADLVRDLAIAPWVFDLHDGSDFMALAEKILKETVGNRVGQTITPRKAMAAFQYWTRAIEDTATLPEEERIHVFLQALSNPRETYLHPRRENVLVCGRLEYRVNGWGYRQFFNQYKETHSPSEIEAIVANKDRMMEELRRRRQGAFFTPTAWVDEAHKMLDESLGTDWREEYVVWDASCGTANLTRDYNFKELYLSTLEEHDVETIKMMGYNKGATVFQFDFLNDPLEKLPAGLRKAIDEGRRIVFLNNPPYGTASKGVALGANKTGVARTAVNAEMLKAKIGPAAQQVYAQYLFRLRRLTANGVLATFTKPAFLTSPSFSKFRRAVVDETTYVDGMMFHSAQFSNVSGAWGVLFSILDCRQSDPVHEFPVKVKDFNAAGVIATVEVKTLYNVDGGVTLSKWVRRHNKGKGVDAPQMASALRVKDATGRGSWINGALASLCFGSNSVYKNQEFVYLATSGVFGGNDFPVLPGPGFRDAVAAFLARKAIKQTWLNDKDEYSAPNEANSAFEQWVNDAVVYSLFNPASNQSSLRNIRYKGEDWNILNEFFWLPIKRMRSLADKHNNHAVFQDVRDHPGKHNGERYVADILKTLPLSADAQTVLDKATDLLVKTFPMRDDVHAAHPRFHLNAWDAGWYQIAQGLLKPHFPDDLKAFRALYKAFEDRLRPGVHELGFLRK